MAFIQASASVGVRDEVVLSADNSRPERHIVIDTLRQAAQLIGLKAPVIATLDAMLSCLPPKRAHNTVFASNATLTFRRNGISDRTIRRHAAILQELGLLVRRDSSNRKRFSRQSFSEGATLRFGFDLSPLFQRFPEISKLAAQALRDQDQIAYLKTKIRAAANDILRQESDNAFAISLLRTLRRNLTLGDCIELFDSLEIDAKNCEQLCLTTVEKEEMSATDGQNVRHLHNSKPEPIDKKKTQETRTHPESRNSTKLRVGEIVQACPEAALFAGTPVKTMSDVISHARTLAPMLGIDVRTYQRAQECIGIEGAALTVWAIMQFHNKIRRVGAYFRSITSGKNSDDFDPEQLVRRVARSQT